MIEHTLDTAQSILYIRLKAALEQSDFVELAKTVDPYIRETGHLAGLIIDAATFPGWEGLGAMAALFRFVRDHQKLITKIALVTDSTLGNVAPNLATHFVAPRSNIFSAGELEAAKDWIMNAG
jgi:hypothetical protein